MFQLGDRIRALENFESDLYEIYGFWGKANIRANSEYTVSFIDDQMKMIYIFNESGPGANIGFADQDKFELI